MTLHHNCTRVEFHSFVDGWVPVVACVECGALFKKLREAKA